MFDRDKKSTDSVVSPGSKSNESRRPDTAHKKGRSGHVAVIGGSIKIKGDLIGDEDLRIEGNVTGTVKLKSNSLTIGKGGRIKAGIYAKSITVDGETSGDLHASECVSIHENARVQGNIIAPRVSIVEGAHFKGSIEMDQEAVENALGGRAKAAQKKAEPKSDSNAAPGEPVKGMGAAAQAKSA